MAKEPKGYQPEYRNYIKQRHNTKGEEILDPKPMQPPLNYKRPPTLSEQIRQQVLASKLDALQELQETDEEADDFEVDDDFEPFSKHENDGMPTVKELKKRAVEIQTEIKKRNMEKLRAQLEAEIAQKRGGEAAPSKPSTTSTTGGDS